MMAEGKIRWRWATPSAIQLRIQGEYRASVFVLLSGNGAAVAVRRRVCVTRRRRRRSAAGRSVAIYCRALYQDCRRWHIALTALNASLVWERRAPTVSPFKVERRRFDERKSCRMRRPARRMSCRDEYPRRAALPLSFHQLHCGPRFTIIRALCP